MSERIDLSDIPETGEDWFKSAKLRHPALLPSRDELRIIAERVLRWCDCADPGGAIQPPKDEIRALAEAAMRRGKGNGCA